MYLQPSRWKLFIEWQTSESSLVLPEKRNAVVMKRVKKEQKTVKFGQQERKRALNLRFVEEIFLL